MIGQNLADWTKEREDDGFCDDLIKADREGWSLLEFMSS